MGSDPEILGLVQEQTKQWTEIMQRHRKEEWEMLKTHLGSSEETFKKLCVAAQAKQMKDLEAFFVRQENTQKSFQLPKQP